MPLTLNQLLASPQTADGWRSLVLGVLQGLGLVVPGGTAGGGVQTGTGSLTLSGLPTQAYPKVVVKIVTAGELGTAVFQYSLDGGTTWSANVTVPAAPGSYSLSTTGATITFVSGPSGGPTSFQLNDTFTFALAVNNLGVTSWGAGSGLRTLAELLAQALADFSAGQVSIAAGGLLQAWLNPSAIGLVAPPPDAWLDLLAGSVYNLTRSQATSAKEYATLTAAAAAGPYTIAAGSMWIADAAGHRFSNLTGGVLNAGPSTLTLQWVAETPDSAHNIHTGTPVTIVAGTLAGVTAALTDSGGGGGDSLFSQGTDQQTSASLAQQCQNRWPSLSAPGTSPAGQFQLWCSLAEAAAGHSTTITRSLALADASLPGQVDIYLAGAGGGAGGGAVTDVQSYLASRTGLTNSVSVQAATNAVMTVAGTVFYFAAKTTLSAATAAVAAALSAYVNGLGIDAGGTVTVYWSEVEAACGSVFGVRNVSITLNGGTADVPLTLGQVATLVNSVAFTGV